MQRLERLAAHALSGMRPDWRQVVIDDPVLTGEAAQAAGMPGTTSPRRAGATKRTA
jgi:hypothetical protein